MSANGSLSPLTPSPNGHGSGSADYNVVPPSADVVIIGGGIIGASTALFLARKGVSVVLCEKGTVGEEQSGRNWGWVRKMGRDIREIPLMIRSMQIWDELNAMTGEETGFRRIGTTYFFETEAEAARYEPWLSSVRQFGIDTRVVDAAEVARYGPGATRKWAGGLRTDSDGCAEPHLATRAILKGARDHGASIVECCAVRGLETSAGRVSEVITEKGRIRCNTVVLAGGVWSTFFARSIGVHFPQLKLLSQVARTRPITGGPLGCGSGRGFGYRQRLDGGYNISMRALYPVDITPDSFRFARQFLPALKHEWKGLKLRLGKQTFREMRIPRRWALDRQTVFERFRTLRPTADSKVLDDSFANMRAIFPGMSEIVVNEKVSAWIDLAPDAIPVISAVEQLPGFHIASGFSGHGFGIGPGAGELMAQIVMGEPTSVDTKAFRHSRFIDGSPIEHWPASF